MTTCNVKGVTHRDKPTHNYQTLSSPELFSISLLLFFFEFTAPLGSLSPLLFTAAPLTLFSPLKKLLYTSCPAPNTQTMLVKHLAAMEVQD